MFLKIIEAFTIFSKELDWLLTLLKNTPQEKREELMAALRKEASEYARVQSRPKWDSSS